MNHSNISKQIKQVTSWVTALWVVNWLAISACNHKISIYIYIYIYIYGNEEHLTPAETFVTLKFFFLTFHNITRIVTQSSDYVYLLWGK
jgi:hypothetical protein